MGPFLTEGQVRFLMAMVVIGILASITAVILVPMWLWTHLSIGWR